MVKSSNRVRFTNLDSRITNLIAFALRRSALCRQRDRLLSPAALSSPRPFELARLRLFLQLFHGRPSKFHRRSLPVATSRSRSRVPVSPFPPVQRGRLSRSSQWSPGVASLVCE